MIGKKIGAAIITLLVVCALISCGKKEQAGREDAGNEAASETASSAVKPGEMVLIPAGDFTMGIDDKDSLAYPKHTVNLPAFWIDKYEVTNSQFMDFSINERYPGEGVKEGKDWRLWFTMDKSQFPVVYITWNDATAYCKSKGMRLPTEEEWEKAARGTDGRAYPWGNDFEPGRANTYESGGGNPVAVGQCDDVSPFGVHDMLGNVQEWTASLYVTYKGNPKRDPNSGKDFRVVRGLGARHRGKLAHLWDRIATPPSSLYNFGFRCVKDATPEEAAKASQSR